MKQLLCLMLMICFTLTGCRDKFQDEPPEILNERVDALNYAAKPSVALPSDELLNELTVTFDSGSRADNITTFEIKIANDSDKVFDGVLNFKFMQKNGDFVDADIVRVNTLSPKKQQLGKVSCKDAPNIELTYMINEYKFSDDVVENNSKVGTQFVDSFIGGSNAYDIAVSLEEKDFPDFDNQEAVSFNGYVLASTTTMDNVDMQCTINSTKEHEVISAIFSVNSSFESSLSSTGYEYLAYCASFPYTLSDSEAVNKWVLDNVGNAVSPETGTSFEVGGVKFELSGTKYSKTLNVSIP